MRQLCNFAYAVLAEGRTRAQMAELDSALAPPEQKEKILAKVTQESMQTLMSPAYGLVAPPPRKQE